MTYAINTPQFKATAAVPEQIQPQTTTAIDDIEVPQPPKKEEKSHLLATSLTGLALLGVAAYLVTKGRKGNIAERTIEMFKRDGNTFEKGIAKCKDGTLFSGVLSQTTSGGDKIHRVYQDGKLVRAVKNFDAQGFHDPTKAVNYDKIYSYNPAGKIDKITHKSVIDGEFKTKEIIPKNIKKMENFEGEGGIIVDGRAVDSSISPYTGTLVSGKGENMVIQEYENGVKMSERLNTTLKDNVIKPDKENYVRTKADLDAIEKAKRIEAERVAEEARKAAEEAKQTAEAEARHRRKLSTRIKNFFKDMFEGNPEE